MEWKRKHALRSKDSDCWLVRVSVWDTRAAQTPRRSPLELLLRLPHPTAAKRLLVSGPLHHPVCSHQRWRCRPRARRTHSSHIRSFSSHDRSDVGAALFGLWFRKNDAPTGASVPTLDVRRASRSLWRQRGLGRRPLPQHPCVLQTGLGHGPAVRFDRRARLAWTELDSSRRQCEKALT